VARILVVDDEEGVRSFMAECLEVDGHQVDQAESGERALELARASSYQLVITDLRMPGIDGLELLRTLRDEQPEVEVIMVTAHGNVENAVEAMRRGAFDYLQKPISGPAELRLLAGRALERRELTDLRERTSVADEPRLGYGDPAMEPVVDALRKVAATKSTVLLVGESGTGKEVAARAVHQLSDRSVGPFVALNCATLSDNLLESELFGHEKGAFTGATERKRGKVELADGGTFFLDEIGELAAGLQAKLLRVLQERTFERVGGTQSIEVDVRWVAATNRDLRGMMEEGTFREDLYHRIAVFPVELPPLRERRGDIKPLAEVLLARIGREIKRPGLSLAPGAIDVLTAASWPGNIRELANVLERAAILADGDVITSADLHIEGGAPRDAVALSGRTLAELERAAIVDALAAVDGNRRQAAERLGIGVRTLYDKIKKYEIE
jgi:two-component system response regulator FlrC